MAELFSTGTSETSRLSAEAPIRLACYPCKKRKVKCNRQLPICSLCLKLDQACTYPSAPEKPGPKARSDAFQPTKRRRLNGRPSSTELARDSSFSATGHAHPPSFDLNGHNSAVASSNPYTAPHHAPHTSNSGREHGANPSSAPVFSRIMYPSHEAQTRPQTPSTGGTSPLQQATITTQSVCAALQISKSTYDKLMNLYFDNMTSFSLFRPGTIESKFAMMQNHSEAEAFVAAMFSFSARHWADQTSNCPSPSYFGHIATSKLDESVDRYGDMRVPFSLMQAGILVTFYQLTQSVRSRSWNRLGNCIRYAYDLNLHVVDANHDPLTKRTTPINLQRWSLLEERRRAWWAVWEMDIFASTIRRLPTGIDGSQNFTLLPVSDEDWFNDTYQESSFLVQDCSLRWRHLAESHNQSSKAWFIVINSLMRNTQRIVYPAGSAKQSFNERNMETNQDELDIMANSLSCTILSLPTNLSYQGETLHFRQDTSPQGANSRQESADKYAIHLMTQLCRFMIYHHKICARAPWLAPNGSSRDPGSITQANSEWSNYMNASNEIVSMVRNSSRDHYKYVNPFLANTLWFAAAAQCACKVFGPSTFNKRLTDSNLDVLKLTLDRFISFWGGMENLRSKLARIEAGLKSLLAGENADTEHRQRHHPAQSREGDIPWSSSAVQSTTTARPDNSQNASIVPAIGSLLVPDTAHADWSGDARWPSFVPDICDFTQPFTIGEGQNFFPSDPFDFSPFGLEELLIAGMNHHSQ